MPRPPQERRQVRRQARQLRLFVRVPGSVQLKVLPQVLRPVQEPARLRGPPLFLLPEPVHLQVPQQVLLQVPETVQRRALLQIRLQVPEKVRRPVPRQVLLLVQGRGPDQRRERGLLAQVERAPQRAPTARRLRAFQPTWELRPSSLRHRTRQA